MSDYLIGSPFSSTSLQGIYDKTDDPRDIARGVILNLDTAATEERSKWEDRAVRTYSFVSGNQYTKKQIEYYRNVTKEIPFVVNILKIFLKRRVSMLNAKAPEFNVYPRYINNNEEGNFSREKLTDCIQTIVNHIFQREQVKIKRGKAIYKMGTIGLGLLAVEWDPFLKEIKVDEIDFRDVYVDPACSDMFDDAAYICITKMLPRKHAENMYGIDLSDVLSESKSNSESKTGLKIRNFTGSFCNPAMDTIRLTQQYESRAVITLSDGTIFEFSQDTLKKIHGQRIKMEQDLQVLTSEIDELQMQLQAAEQEGVELDQETLQESQVQLEQMVQEAQQVAEAVALLGSVRTDRRIRMTVVAGTDKLIGREWLATKTYPVIGYFEELSDNPYPGSCAQDAQDLQRGLNKSLSSIIRNAQRLNSERTFVSSGSMQPAELQQLRSQNSAPGGVYEVKMDSQYGKPITEHAVPIAQDFYTIPRVLDEFMQKVVGVSDMTFDAQMQRKSVIERILETEERNEGLLGEILRYLSASDKKLLSVVVDYIQSYLSEEELYQILEVDKEETLEQQQQAMQMLQQAEQAQQQLQAQAQQQMQQIQQQAQQQAAAQGADPEELEQAVAQAHQQVQQQVEQAYQQIQEMVSEAEQIMQKLEEPLSIINQITVFKEDLQIGTYDIDVVSGSTLPSTSSAWLEVLRLLRNDGIISDPTPIIERLPLPEKTKIIEREGRYRALQSENAQLQQQLQQISQELGSMKQQNEKLGVDNVKTRLKASNYVNQSSLRHNVKTKLKESELKLQALLNDFRNKMQKKDIQIERLKGSADELPTEYESIKSEFESILGSSLSGDSFNNPTEPEFSEEFNERE